MISLTKTLTSKKNVADSNDFQVVLAKQDSV
jgi:hypothetical protein